MPEYIPGLAGVPAAQSSISFVDGENGILEYRGIRIEELTRNSSYEETAYLLLHNKLPTESELKAFSDKLANNRPIPPQLVELIKGFPREAHPMDALQTGVAALGMFSKGGDYSDPAFREEKAVAITAQFPTIVGAFQQVRDGKEPLEPDSSLSHAADFLRMLTGTMPDELDVHIIDTSLILHADHTMNASTFTARVTASTIANPYAVVGAAVGSLSGPLHGGANERVLIMLRSVGDKSKIKGWVEEKTAKKERIMGLGHRVYKTKDPRSIILQELAVQLFDKKGKSDVYDIALELEEVTKDTLGAKGIYPTGRPVTSRLKPTASGGGSIPPPTPPDSPTDCRSRDDHPYICSRAEIPFDSPFGCLLNAHDADHGRRCKSSEDPLEADKWKIAAPTAAKKC